jgi:galactokinase
VRAALDAAARAFATRFGDRHGARTWWAPGRVELLGKHVDYAGGRSLLSALDRGIAIVARPRQDDRVNLFDARTGHTFFGAVAADLEQTPGRWTDYPISVLRRLARDFPGATRGMDAAIASDLPSAAGLSSSSALVIATFLPLQAFNDLEARADWPCAGARASLAGYLGAVENGRGFGATRPDFGVGTQGGSQDHLAILCSTARSLLQARFLPAAVERQVTFPAEWHLVVASSGIAASKGSAVRDRYNALANEAQGLLAAWQEAHDPTVVSLLDVLATQPGAEEELRRLVAGHPERPALERRLAQFREETMELVPTAVRAAAGRDMAAFGRVITRSYVLGREALRNQVAATIHLAERAVELGAAGASPFGAGFGGSVYAVVAAGDADAFATAWREDYRQAFPAVAERAEFLAGAPAEGAHEVITG